MEEKNKGRNKGEIGKGRKGKEGGFEEVRKDGRKKGLSKSK